MFGSSPVVFGSSQVADLGVKNRQLTLVIAKCM